MRLVHRILPIGAVLSILLLVSVPRLLINYGFDDDTVRGVIAGETLSTTGVYLPSRLPGNPLFEYLLALLVPLGHHFATNLFVLSSFVLGIYFFYLLVSEHSAAFLLTAIYALTPVLVLNAATTMDYIPGLALMLGAYVFLARQKRVAAGILLGLSIGFRLSNLLLLVPMVLFLLSGRARAKTIFSVALLSACTGLLFYVPVLMTYGYRMFVIPASIFGLKDIAFRTVYNGLMLFGPFATLVIGVLFLADFKNILGKISLIRRNVSPHLLFEMSALSVFLLLFIRHSDETAYLIPAVPFFYLLIARFFSPRLLLPLGIALLSFGFFSFELKGGQSGQRKITFKPASGIVVEDYRQRKELEEMRSHLDRYPWPQKAVVMTGMGPILTYRNPLLTPAAVSEMIDRMDGKGIWEASNLHRLTGRTVFFVYALSRDNVEKLRRAGYEIYMFSESAPSTLINLFRYDPFALGIKQLKVFDENPFYETYIHPGT